MPFKLSPRDTLIAVGVGAALVLVLFLVLGFRPQLTQLTSLKAEQKVEADKLETNKLKLKRLDAIRREAADIEVRRINLSRRMPSNPELPSFIIELQRLANDADMDLIELKFNEPDQGGNFSTIGFDFKANASFYTLVDFLYRLEGLQREVVVDEFKISGGGYPLLSIDVKARTFSVIEKPVVESAPADAAQPAAAGAAPNATPAAPAP